MNRGEPLEEAEQGGPGHGCQDQFAAELSAKLDLTNSQSSLAIPDCDPEHAFTSAILPTFGPLPDPSSDPLFDDNMMMEQGQEAGDVTGNDAGPAMCGSGTLAT